MSPDPLTFRSQELVLFLVERAEAGEGFVPGDIFVRLVVEEFGGRWSEQTVRRTLNDLALYGVLAREKGASTYRITVLGSAWLGGLPAVWPWPSDLRYGVG